MASEPATPRSASGIAVERSWADFATPAAITDLVAHRRADAVVLTFLESGRTPNPANSTGANGSAALWRSTGCPALSTMLCAHIHIGFAAVGIVAIAILPVPVIAIVATGAVLTLPAAVRSLSALQITAAAIVHISAHGCLAALAGCEPGRAESRENFGICATMKTQDHSITSYP